MTQEVEDPVSFCSQVGSELHNSNDEGKFDVVLNAVASEESLQAVPCVLDQVNQQAREEHNMHVATDLIATLERRPIDARHNYKSKELAVETVTVTQSDILAKRSYTLNMLDAQYVFTAESLEWQFPNQEGQDFLVQGLAVRAASGATQALIRMEDTMSEEAVELSELDGQAKLRFSIRDSVYVPGQTVCQGYQSST